MTFTGGSLNFMTCEIVVLHDYALRLACFCLSRCGDPSLVITSCLLLVMKSREDSYRPAYRTRSPPAEIPPPLLSIPHRMDPSTYSSCTSIMSYAANLTNHNPSDYSQNASFVYSAKYTNAVLGLLDAKPGERIIDLGCGTAELTRQIKEAVGAEGFVAGVDSSEEMVCARQGLELTHSWSKLENHRREAVLNSCNRISRNSARMDHSRQSGSTLSTRSLHQPHYTGVKPTRRE